MFPRTAAFLLLTLTAPAQTLTVLHNFAGGSDGTYPSSGLVFDTQGNLYGVTSNGGNRECSGLGLVGCGVVYQLAPNGGGFTESVIHVFSESLDGGNPSGTPVFDAAGRLFGTTQYYALGQGAVWELTPSAGGPWTGNLMYAFNSPSQGFSPSAVAFYRSRLFGSTFSGGAHNDGLIFHLYPDGGSWNEHVTYNFQAGSDGNAPAGPLIFDEIGNMYGTTYEGGPFLTGTVFELARIIVPGGYTEQILYTFQGFAFGASPDGANPTSGVIGDRQGNLYGTTYYGGPAGVGTVFKLAKQSDQTFQESVIYSFTDHADGGHPNGLLMDAAGNLYGTTAGHKTAGSIYKLSPESDGSWQFTLLHEFTGPDGASPSGPVVMDAAGNLYGATTYGGASDIGVVFKLTP